MLEVAFRREVWYNRGTMTKPKTIQRVDKSPSGTQERAVEDLTRYVEHSDLPMVKVGLAGQIANSANMDAIPSKMYEDKGKKLQAVQYLARRGKEVSMPKDRAGVFEALEGFFTFCGTNEIPPTIGAFAVWCGVSLTRINQIERDRTDERSEALRICKDSIRAFLELAAMDSTVNPILYFHMNKVYFGAVENQQVTIRVDDNTRELTDDEVAERVRMLQREQEITLEPDVHGVYSPVE